VNRYVLVLIAVLCGANLRTDQSAPPPAKRQPPPELLPDAQEPLRPLMSPHFFCRVASDHEFSWFPVGTSIRWRPVPSSPGRYGCFGLAYERSAGRTTVTHEFNLTGDRSFAADLRIKSTWNHQLVSLDPQRALLPLLRDLFSAEARKPSSRFLTCVSQLCTDRMDTGLGPAVLSYKPAGGGKSEYTIQFDLTRAPLPVPNWKD